MIRRALRLLLAFAFVILGLCAIYAGLRVLRNTSDGLDVGSDGAETVEITRYTPPKDDDSSLVDDRIEDKKTTFDPTLVDRRPVGTFEMNASDSVLRLDVPMAKPDQNPEQLVLHPSYAAAIDAAHGVFLPSVNLIDGKAKQFDDGLYAAIDQAYFLGHGEQMKGHVATLRRIHDKVAKPSGAADYLAAGLSIGPEPVETSPEAKGLAREFLAREFLSKPIGFYTWNKTLTQCFQVLRFFAVPIRDRAVPVEIARVLRENPDLRDDYTKGYTFYAGLTNPLVGRTPADLIDGPRQGPLERIALFPQSTTRETELFDKLFPNGLPGDANLMRELITAIRSGKVDLKPGAKGGWYDYQVYALETLLMPEKGAEANKLLLTKSYKKRMLEAFEALITKRRETHSRQAKFEAPGEASIDSVGVAPRLRVEPNPSFYLRTARSYAFLANFLESRLGEPTLKTLKGLREGGERDMDLDAELRWMRDLFYGLALMSAEDIGFRLPLLEGEGVAVEACESIARAWLTGIPADRDLAADTRVSVPVSYDPSTQLVRIWATIGVRLTALDVRYARGPSLRPLDGSAGWKAVESYNLHPSTHLIPVDEFAEVEVRGGRVYNRAELRALCDRAKTKEKIVEALAK